MAKPGIYWCGIIGLLYALSALLIGTNEPYGPYVSLGLTIVFYGILMLVSWKIYGDMWKRILAVFGFANYIMYLDTFFSTNANFVYRIGPFLVLEFVMTATLWWFVYTIVRENKGEDDENATGDKSAIEVDSVMSALIKTVIVGIISIICLSSLDILVMLISIVNAAEFITIAVMLRSKK